MKLSFMRNIFILLRPSQWVKNLFVFLPLFFDGHLLDWNYFYHTLWVFIAFIFASSTIYCFNDIQDREYDKLHQEKSKRPVASGGISVGQAYVIMLFCLLITLTFSFLIIRNIWLSAIIGLYLLLNFLYCLFLKTVAIIDVSIISFGYILRIWAGGVITGACLSHWIVLMTFLLSLFLAFAKRRDDVLLYQDTGIKARRCITEYNAAFIDRSLSVLASIIMVCYIMYTVSEDVIVRLQCPWLYLTSIFVLLGLLRYLLLTTKHKTGSPTYIFVKDRFIQSCILLWLLTFLIIIYL